MAADANQPPGGYPPQPGAPGYGAPGDPPPTYGGPGAPPPGPVGYDLAGQPPQGPYGGTDPGAQASAYAQPVPAKKGSVLPWVIAVIFLLTSIGGFGWALSLKSTADKRQKELTQTQARISQLESEIKSLTKDLEQAKGLSKDQQNTLGKAKQIGEQMYETTIQAAKEMNQIIHEFNNVVVRFNANDISGANAAINQARQNIEKLMTQLTKYDELAAQFEQTIGKV